jgi:hypothetical protein
MARSPAPDLDWLAFCYVNEELSAEQQESFEALLDGDQAAREALANAVVLSQAMSVVPAPVQRRASWVQRAGWVALGAAACLAIVVMSKNWFSDPSHSSQISRSTVSPSSPQGQELALAWATLSGPPADEAGYDDFGISAVDREGDRGVSVPAWMLEALSITEPSPESPSGSEES